MGSRQGSTRWGLRVCWACLTILLAGPSAQRLEAQVTPCDKLAASPEDAQAVAPGVPFGEVDGEAAVAACTAAAERAPEAARFHFQLGRALTRLGRFEEAFQQYRRALDLAPGYVVASINLGNCYLEGLGVRKDQGEALKLIRPVAEQGHRRAQFIVASAYAAGRGVQKDDVEAARWCRRAAEQGDATAQGLLGRMYAEGRGVGQDYVEAMKWSRFAADQGLSGAQLDVGLLYARGQGVRQNDADAVNWYRKAAKGGNAQAQMILGWHYWSGSGVKKDFDEAMKWSRLAADQGHPTAMVHVAKAYDDGVAVKRDDAEALGWYRKAAALQEPTAIGNIGVFYQNGRGVPRDLEQAAAHYRRAADMGLDWAKQNLDSLISSGQALPPAPKPLVLERPAELAMPVAPPVNQPAVSSLQVTAEPTTVRVGETVELRLSYAVQSGQSASVAVQQRWTLSFAGQALPNFPLERETTRASGSFSASYSQTIPAVAAPGRYDVRGEVCAGGDCVSRSASFEVIRQ